MVAQSPKVSILVPICNVEKYLSECLKSLINQTLADIEIICLDDGSTDNSLSIIKKYAKNDPRIIIVSKPNTGYGDTMNMGIKKAHGEYIGIVESDDWVDSDMFKDLYELAVQSNADIVKSNFYYYFSDLTKGSNLYNESLGGVWSAELKQVVTKHDILADLIPADLDNALVTPKNDNPWLFYLPPSIWSAIYKTSFIRANDITFSQTPGASYQDIGFAFKTLLMADRVVLTSKSYLHYRQDNEKSSVNNPGKVMCVVDESKGIKQFLAAHKIVDPKVLKIANRVKFGNYKWNLNRLSFDLAKKFVPVMSKEFMQDRKLKRIDWFSIDETDTRMLNEIIDHPSMYIKRLLAQTKAKVSVILPIYNVENYIEECIESIVNQSMEDIEIICVDDGCEDSSVSLVEKYWSSDPRITILHKNNGGLSSARNYGMGYSHADYIMFCDSDDLYHDTTCEELYNAIRKHNTDLATCRINVIYYSNFDSIRSDRLYYSLKFDGKHEITHDILVQCDVSSCNKIFKRTTILKYHLLFPDGLLYEDYYFVKAYMLLSKTIYFLDKPLYDYVRRPGSIMSTTFSNGTSRSLDHMLVYFKLYYDYNKKYNLIARDTKYFIDEFKDTFSFSYLHLPENQRSQLYKLVAEFINANTSYLNNIDPHIIRSIKELLPHYTALQRAKLSIKNVYKRFSPGYRNRIALQHSVEELDNHIRQLSTYIHNSNIGKNNK